MQVICELFPPQHGSSVRQAADPPAKQGNIDLLLCNVLACKDLSWCSAALDRIKHDRFREGGRRQPALVAYGAQGMPKANSNHAPALWVLVPVRGSVDIALGAVGPEDGPHLLSLPPLVGWLPPW